MPIRMLLLAPGSDKDVIRHGVPSIVDADEEEQQRCRPGEEEDLGPMGVTQNV